MDSMAFLNLTEVCTDLALGSSGARWPLNVPLPVRPHIVQNGKGVELFGKGPQRCCWVRWTMSPQQQFGCSAAGTTVILCSEVGDTKTMTCLTIHC